MITRKTLTENEMAALLKQDATPVPSGVILMRHDGKLFMINDHKMPDGRMVSEMAVGPAASRK